MDVSDIVPGYQYYYDAPRNDPAVCEITAVNPDCQTVTIVLYDDIGQNADGETLVVSADDILHET